MPSSYFPASAWLLSLLLALGLPSFGATPPSASAAAPVSKTASTPSVFDTAAIHGAYADGDFEKVTSTLEPVLAAKTILPKADSVFLYRHLGVIYAKDPGTREKGKYCFRKLLDVDPQAQILDLYATDEIYQVFRTVQAEWDLSHPNAQGQAVASNRAVAPAPAMEPAAPPAAKPARSGQTWKRYAAVGGAVAVTAGLTTWYLLSSQKEDSKKVTLEVDPAQPK